MHLPIEINDPSTMIQVRNLYKPRFVMYRMLSNILWQPYFSPICCDINDPPTRRNGFAKRLLRNLPEPNRELLAKLSLFVDSFLHKIDKTNFQYLTFEDWLATTSYNENRKEQLRRAFDRNRKRYGRPDTHRSHHLETFMKQECYPRYKNARGIMSRYDGFKVWFGPIVKSIEAVIYNLPYFVKNKTPEERVQQLFELANTPGFVYATDFTSFESHFTPEILAALEFKLYSYFMTADDFLFLRKILGGTNILDFRNGDKYKCVGRRMSGEMSTSLANGFSNLMLGMFLASQQGATFHGLVEGDDGLFVTSAKLCAADYSQLGFDIKIKTCRDVYDADFCGIVLTHDKNVIKNPYRVFQKLNYILHYNNARQSICDSLLKGKCLSLLYELPSCPIVSALANEVSNMLSVKPKFENDGYHTSSVGAYREVSCQTRIDFQNRFSIDVSSQLLVEGLIKKHDFLAAFTMLFGLSFVPNPDNSWSIANAHDNVDYYSKQILLEAF